MADAEAGKGGSSGGSQGGNDVTWGFRLLGRIIGTLAAVGMTVLGLFTMISLSGSCILAGFMMMAFGCAVMMIEAPIFCQYFKWAEKVTEFVDTKPYFLRAGLYLVLSIIPFATCTSLVSFFGCGGLFVAGTFYGVIAVGKKGDLSTGEKNFAAGYIPLIDHQ